VLALAIDQFTLPVFGDVGLEFGGWLPLLAALVLGPWHGVLAAGLANLPSLVGLDHAWALVVALLEAGSIGYLNRRYGRPFLGAALYWLLLGTPIVTLGVLQFSELIFPNNWATIVKFPANGLLMVMIAIAALNSRRFRRAVGVSPEREGIHSLRDVLFQRFGLIVILTTATLAILVGYNRNHVLRDQAKDSLVADVREVARDIASKIDTHQRVLQLLANHAEVEADTMNQLLDATRQQFPSFLTMLSADRAGFIVAAAPNISPDGTDILRSRINVADRAYFREPLRTGRPYISPVFRGRGFGDDLIIALSAPTAQNESNGTAIVEGSLDLKKFIGDVAGPAQIEGRGLLLVDSIGQVVASAGILQQPVLVDIANSPLARLAKRSQNPSFEYPHTDGHRRELMLVAYATIAPHGWRIYLAEPVWRFQSTLGSFYLATFIASAVAIALAVFLARHTATDVTRPLAAVVGSIQALTQKDAPPPDAEPQLARELTDLSRAAHDAALVLSNANRELAGALDQRNRSHQQLRQVLLHLDEKVQRRTQELVVALQQAESANRAKSEFIAAISHELRTPLNVILGMSEVLTEQTVGPLNERQIESVRYIDESGRHLLALINDILDLSKIEAGKLELDRQETSLYDLCESSLRLVRPAAEAKGQQLTLERRTPDLSLHIDGRRIKQVLVNLLSNAIKFTPNGGSITLEASAQPGRRELTIAVIDTGIGVPPEYRDKLFKPFQQIDGALNRRHSGTGLGLALVRRITEMHGGRADLESTPGQGSRFYIVLPLDYTAPAFPFMPALASDAAVGLVGRHVLIADDQETNVLLYRSLPALAGARITVARTGREAIDVALADQPDLVLMDVQMPEMDGLEATRRLRADPRTADLPIIIITALASEEDRARCLEAGANSYLSKPISPQEFALQVAETLRHRPTLPT